MAIRAPDGANNEVPALNFLCEPKPLSFFNCVELNKIELFLIQTKFYRIINLYTTRTSKCLCLDKELGVSRVRFTKTQVCFAVCVLHSALPSTLSETLASPTLM